jgi:hypothetical protein
VQCGTASSKHVEWIFLHFTSFSPSLCLRKARENDSHESLPILPEVSTFYYSVWQSFFLCPLGKVFKFSERLEWIMLTRNLLFPFSPYCHVGFIFIFSRRSKKMHPRTNCGVKWKLRTWFSRRYSVRIAEQFTILLQKSVYWALRMNPYKGYSKSYFRWAVNKTSNEKKVLCKKILTT